MSLSKSAGFRTHTLRRVKPVKVARKHDVAEQCLLLRDSNRRGALRRFLGTENPHQPAESADDKRYGAI